MQKKVSIFLLFIGFTVVASAQTIAIGTQVWSARNLDVFTFRNGDSIPQARTKEEWESAGKNIKPAWCYYNNDPAKGAKYGKLYNWYAVNDPRGLAPVGYHIPSDREWTLLTVFLGGEKLAGAKMKSNIGWADKGNGTNESRFTGLPGGLRASNGTFEVVGDYGYWWSATATLPYLAMFRFLIYYDGSVTASDFTMDYGMSVRCVRD